jgi:hypothetical protein
MRIFPEKKRKEKRIERRKKKRRSSSSIKIRRSCVAPDRITEKKIALVYEYTRRQGKKGRKRKKGGYYIHGKFISPSVDWHKHIYI